MAGTVSAGTIIYEVDMDTAGILQGRRDIDAALAGLNGSMGRVEASINRTERSMGSMERTMSSLSGVAKGLLAALSVQQVASYADAWTELNNKVANSIRAGETQVQVMQRIHDISQATQSSLNGTAVLYSRLERGTREYNTSAADLVKLTTIINQGFAVSGATAAESENAIIQLSQGIASGVLRGEEFNSVSEQGSRLMVALADSLGVGIGQLRKMAMEGKLTTDVVVNGLLSQGDTIGKEFANTTVSISKGLLVAGNNVTKFFGENSTVKSFSAAFRDSVISVSENLEGLGQVLALVAAFLGSRYAGALTMAAAATAKQVIANRQLVIAERDASATAALQAQGQLRAAEASKVRAFEEVRLAQMMKSTAVSATQTAAAEATLSAARTNAAAAAGRYNAALEANVVAQNAAAAAASRASITTGIMRGALGLVGGPAGAAMLAGAAIYYFYQQAEKAKQESRELADGVENLTSKMKDMSQVQLSAEIAKLRDTIPDLTEDIADAQDAFNKATGKVRDYQQEIDNWSTATKRGRQAQEAMQGALDNLAIAANDLTNAQNRLSRVQSTIGIAQAQVNGQFRQGIDLLRRNGEEVGTVAGLMNNLGNALNFAARAKQNFNSKSLMVERPANVQAYLDKLNEQIALESEADERKRAQLKAEKEIRALGGDDAAVRMARERAGAEYDAIKAQQVRKKEDSAASSTAKKTANEQEIIAQKLANLKQQTELSAGSTQELSKEQAILTAQLSLGKGATQEQIALAGKYTAEKWDTTNALKAQAAAEKLLPDSRENASYKQDVQDLNTALSAKKISQEQYIETAEWLEQQHQTNLAKIRAQKVVNPMQQAQGEIDPVQQLANQQAQQLAMIQQFETQKGQLTQRGLELMNAANTEYEQKRIEAQWEIFRNQSQSNELLASSLEGLQSGASNAITGLVNGTQSLQESFANIGSTILNSVVGSLVQMGMEYVKSSIMARIANSTAAASAAATGASITASMAPAAAATSVATMGTASTIGLAAMTSAIPAMIGLFGGARYNGGPVSADSMYRVGEKGKPEIFKASNGSQYMIPGDNGRVISNQDMMGASGGGSVIQQEIHFNIQTTGGIDNATMAKMSQMMKQVALFQISDQANRPNGMIQPRTKR